jgi:histidinol dehydrogenase
MMQLIQGFQNAIEATRQANAARQPGASPEIETAVREICQTVQTQGDAALLRYEEQFGCPTLQTKDLRVDQKERNAAWNGVPHSAKKALQHAADNIEEFHRHQPSGDWNAISKDGVNYGQRYLPIERVGLYAPHGRAVYPSTVLMVGIPAKVAGVPEVVLASPADKTGNAHPLILAAAQIAGIEEIYKIGGAQGMAALAYGTATIPRVDKIVGPGSIYVTLAKKYLYGAVGIDGLFGPSEVAILADKNADPARLAIDLMAQAEHGADSFVCLIVTSQELASKVLLTLNAKVKGHPREEILQESLSTSSLFVVDHLREAIGLCNTIAAEHVEIWSGDAQSISQKIKHAGAIFLNTPVPFGDYIAGPSHTLPTGTTARFAAGVGVDTFLKRSSIVSASPEALAKMSEDLAILANLEELPAHADAVHLDT